MYVNGLRSIGSGKPILSKPKAIPSKQVFLVLFCYLFNKRTPFKCPRQLREQNRTEQNRTEQNRTEQSYHYSPVWANSEIVVPFPFKLTYHCNKTTRRVTFMQKFKQITNRDTGWVGCDGCAQLIFPCKLPRCQLLLSPLTAIHFFFFALTENHFV